MEPRMHRWFIDAADLRATADYDPEGIISAAPAATAIAQAREMLTAIERHLPAAPP
jgi:hypothetical protein